jgi:hypothetical protein
VGLGDWVAKHKALGARSCQPTGRLGRPKSTSGTGLERAQGAAALEQRLHASASVSARLSERVLGPGAEAAAVFPQELNMASPIKMQPDTNKRHRTTRRKCLGRRCQIQTIERMFSAQSQFLKPLASHCRAIFCALKT